MYFWVIVFLIFNYKNSGKLLFNKIIMGRTGDIDSKSIASRVPMEVYIRLLTEATSKKMTLSKYIGVLVANSNSKEKGGRIDQPIDNTKYYENQLQIKDRTIDQTKQKIYELTKLIKEMEIKHKSEIKGWIDEVKDSNREIAELKAKK